MANVTEREKAIIEFTCIPGVDIEKAKKLYELGFTRLKEFLDFSMEEKAKARGLVDILNYRILHHYLDIEEEIAIQKIRCPFCRAVVYVDEEICKDCGALVLEEIMNIDMADVYNGIKEMMEATLSDPTEAKKYLEDMKGTAAAGETEEMEIATGELVTVDSLVSEQGVVVSKLNFGENGTKSPILTLCHINHNVGERNKFLKDLSNQNSEEETFLLETEGNIIHNQERMVKSILSKHLSDDVLNSLNGDQLFILNLKIARIWESTSLTLVEDNRGFLPLLDNPEIEENEELQEKLNNLLYYPELIKYVRRVGERFILDSVTFNNDPMSFFTAKECMGVMQSNPKFNIILLDIIVNCAYIDANNHNDLIQIIAEWE